VSSNRDAVSLDSVLHRLNVAVFGLRARHWETYVAAADEPACGAA
jgi:hypothetical protein